MIAEAHAASPDDVDKAVDAASNAFPHWSSLNAHERAAPLEKLSALIFRDAEEIAKLDAISMGK